MSFRQILVPILVLVAVNSRSGLGLPHQSIRFSFEKVSPFLYPGYVFDEGNLLQGIATKTVRRLAFKIVSTLNTLIFCSMLCSM